MNIKRDTPVKACLCGSCCIRALFFLYARDDHAGESEERDGVGNDHQLVEHVGELPDKVVGGERTEEDENQRDDFIDADSLLPEEVDDVDLAEHVPAKDS